MVRRQLPLLVGVILLLAVGVVHGLWTNRWQSSAEMEEAVARLRQLPDHVGDWKGEEAEQNPEELKLAGATGHWSRTFTNAETGERVLVILMVGKPARMAVHRPEHCYRAAGYELTAAKRVSLTPAGAPAAELWKGMFTRDEAAAGLSRMQIYWAWSAAGRWEAPDNPRLAFAHHRALYKLYVIHAVTGRRPGRRPVRNCWGRCCRSSTVPCRRPDADASLLRVLMQGMMMLHQSNAAIQDPAPRAETAPPRLRGCPPRRSIVVPVTWYAAAKRIVDVGAALVLMVLAAPVVLIAALLIKLTSRGPVIYTQTRVGKGGQPFTIYKLRSMYHDCERYTGAQWSRRGDLRVMPIGRLLRRLHIDELPQLWNILKGDMSLVGPRPERPEFVPQLELAIPHYRERLLVLPGVTGLCRSISVRTPTCPASSGSCCSTGSTSST